MQIVNKIVTSFTVRILKKILNDEVKVILKENLRYNLKELLSDQEIARHLWFSINKRPDAQIPDYIYMPYNIQKEMYRIAGEESARYILDNHPIAYPFMDEESLLRHSVDCSIKNNLNGLYLEFGVFSGRTINIISAMVKEHNINVHGFDSFEGLPEDWNNTALKGSYSLDGKMPIVNDNVLLYKGLFDHSLPAFLQLNHDKVSFLHIDSDLYSSAKIILSSLKDRIIKGTVIQFDEFLNYPTFKEHEYKAFNEFIKETRFSYKCIGFDTTGFAVSFIIE